jgi:RNA polymerase sigma-70 factor (ECF subfamily)
MPGPHIDLSVYDDEQRLLEALRQGEPDACTCLVKRFAPLIFARAMHLTNDGDEAENILQQTFMKACERVDSFEGRSGLGSWLYRIATNEGLMHLRKRNPQVKIDDIAETLPVEEGKPGGALDHDPAESALAGELREYLARALAELPENLRVVFILREVQGLSTEETAAALGIREGTIKVRLHRARQRLREMMTGYLQEKNHE